MAKAKLTFEDIDLTLTVPIGVRVIDISEKVESGVIYGCREGDCGTCMMKVVDGWENLSTPSVIEDRVLRENGAQRHFRLACQAQVLGNVIIRPA